VQDLGIAWRRRIAGIARHVGDQLAKLTFDLVQPPPGLARQRQRQHSKGPVALDLDQPLRRAADAPWPDRPVNDDGEAGEAALVEAEVAGRQGVAVEHPGRGQALAGQLRQDLLLEQRLGRAQAVGAQQLDLDRGDHLAGRGGEPVVGEVPGQVRLEQLSGRPRLIERVGHELGMALPFQPEPPELGQVMAGAGRGVSAAVEIDEGGQMGEVRCRIALGGALRLLDRQEQHPARRVELDEGPGMELVGQRIAQRVVGQRALDHGPVPLGVIIVGFLSPAPLLRRPAGFRRTGPRAQADRAPRAGSPRSRRARCRVPG